ncbi:MAG: hypothetical protein IJV00_06115 [Clostridia bacterium]|nr:hypothetical protein [Clostridia bacterium]
MNDTREQSAQPVSSSPEVMGDPIPARPKRKRRFGDRKDGRRVRTLCPMNYVSPYIMSPRNDAQNFLKDTVCIDTAEEYLREKKDSGLKGFSLMHLIVAAYVRALATYPGLNRFIAGQKIYARYEVEVSLTVKQGLEANSPETVIKIVLDPYMTATEVYQVMTDAVEKARSNDNKGFDKTAGALNHIPGLVLRTAVGLLRGLDYFGWLPQALVKVSPFHATMFITSMGSLGIPPIFHHLYNFGNVPVFIAFGAKRSENVLNDDGSVSKKKFVDVTFVLDERTCDGHYYASGLKLFRRIMANPRQLDERPETVAEDID